MAARFDAAKETFTFAELGEPLTRYHADRPPNETFAAEVLGLKRRLPYLSPVRTGGPGPAVVRRSGPSAVHCPAVQAAVDSASAGLRWRPCGCTHVFSADAPPRCLPEPPVPAPSSAPDGRCWVVSVRISDMWEVTPL